MRKRLWLGLGGLLGGLGLVLGLTAPVHSQRLPAAESLPQRLARSTKLPEDGVVKLLNALGPAIREDLQKGNTVSLPGLGVFRVVRIPEHRDMRDGRPVTVPAVNTIEFLPTGEAADALNYENVEPAETVPQFQYITLPGQTPGQKAGRMHAPSTRIR